MYTYTRDHGDLVHSDLVWSTAIWFGSLRPFAQFAQSPAVSARCLGPVALDSTLRLIPRDPLKSRLGTKTIAFTPITISIAITPIPASPHHHHRRPHSRLSVIVSCPLVAEIRLPHPPVSSLRQAPKSSAPLTVLDTAGSVPRFLLFPRPATSSPSKGSPVCLSVRRGRELRPSAAPFACLEDCPL
jgi:hypothetical protein